MKCVLVVNQLNDPFYIDYDEKFATYIIDRAKEKGLLEPDSLLTELDANLVMQLFSPLMLSQWLLVDQTKEPCSAIHCPNGFCLVFKHLDDLLVMAINGDGSETEVFLHRKIQVLLRLIRFMSGPVCEEAGLSHAHAFNKKAKWNFIRLLMTNWSELAETEQSFAFEAIERIHVNQIVNEKCVDVLEQAVKQIQAVRDIPTQHALLLVNNKLLALYSNRNAIELQSKDILAIMVLARTLYPHTDKLEDLFSRHYVGPKSGPSSNKGDYSDDGGEDEFHSAPNTPGGNDSRSLTASTEVEDEGFYWVETMGLKNGVHQTKKRLFDQLPGRNTILNTDPSASSLPSPCDDERTLVEMYQEKYQSQQLGQNSDVRTGAQNVNEETDKDSRPTSPLSSDENRSGLEKIQTLAKLEESEALDRHSKLLGSGNERNALMPDGSPNRNVPCSTENTSAESNKTLTDLISKGAEITPEKPAGSDTRDITLATATVVSGCSDSAGLTAPGTEEQALKESSISSVKAQETTKIMPVDEEQQTSTVKTDSVVKANEDRPVDKNNQVIKPQGTSSRSAVQPEDLSLRLATEAIIRREEEEKKNIEHPGTGDINQEIQSLHLPVAYFSQQERRMRASSLSAVPNMYLSDQRSTPSTEPSQKSRSSSVLSNMTTSYPELSVAIGPSLPSSDVTDDKRQKKQIREKRAARQPQGPIASSGVSLAVDSAQLMYQTVDYGGDGSLSTTTSNDNSYKPQTIFLETRTCLYSPYHVHSAQVLPGVTLVMLSQAPRKHLADDLYQATHNIQDLLYGRRIKMNHSRSIAVYDIINSLFTRLYNTLKKYKGRVRTLIYDIHTCWEKEDLKYKLLNFLEKDQRTPIPPELESPMLDLYKRLKELFACLFLSPVNESPQLWETLSNLRMKINAELLDYREYLNVKAQRNITMTSYLNEFPGLIHFVFIDRLFHEMTAPSLNISLKEGQSMDATSYLKGKIWKHYQNMMCQLMNGYTTVLLRDGDFYFSYFLWFEDHAGNALQVGESFKPSKKLPYPGILSGSFYRDLIQCCFPNAIQGSVHCFEMFLVHLGTVHPQYIAMHCKKLAHKMWEMSGEFYHSVSLF